MRTSRLEEAARSWRLSRLRLHGAPARTKSDREAAHGEDGMRGDFFASRSIGFRSLRRGVSALAMAGGLCWGGAGQAQTLPGQPARQPQSASAEPAGDQDAGEGRDIVVTGTLLRGVAPVGTNVVSLNRADVLATRAASANALLASVPQGGNFGTVPVGTGSYALPIIRPNIRNLGASGGSTTLVL